MSIRIMTTTGMRGKDGKRVLFILQCIIYYYISTLLIYLFSNFKTFLDVNRWVYDKERGISIKTKNPQRAKDQAILPKDQIEMNGIALGARVTDGKLTRSSRLLTKQKLHRIISMFCQMTKGIDVLFASKHLSLKTRN